MFGVFVESLVRGRHLVRIDPVKLHFTCGYI